MEMIPSFSVGSCSFLVYGVELVQSGYLRSRSEFGFLDMNSDFGFGDLTLNPLSEEVGKVFSDDV